MARVHPRYAPRLALLALAALTGCQTGSTSALSRWRMARDPSVAKSLTDDPDDRGMMARWLSPKKPKASDPNTPPGLVLGPGGWNPKKVAPDPEAEAEFHAAEVLFQQGKYAEAEPLFAKMAKKKKDTIWGEKAQFYLAETQYQRGNLVSAHDSYEQLVATYPGTQFLEKLVAREYEIAQAWLPPADAEAKAPELTTAWNDRFTGRRPLVDTSGHALAVLEHVRLHDPTGPLADDAVLRIADHHFAAQDFESAAVYYDQLIADHPKSPYLQRAQLASIDAKMKGYLGPDYDGAGLEQAREMVKQTMITFPERQASTGPGLYRTLDLISDQEAERAYNRGLYYRRTGHVASAEHYMAMIPHKWPKSPWAPKAKKHLAELAKMPRKEALPSKIMTQPGSTDPFSSGPSGGGAMSGMNGMGGTPGAGMAAPSVGGSPY